MNEQAIKDFLAQFATSRDNVEKWPSWMRDSAKVASAAFPRSHQSAPAKTPETALSKNKEE